MLVEGAQSLVLSFLLLFESCFVVICIERRLLIRLIEVVRFLDDFVAATELRQSASSLAYGVEE